AVEGVEGADLDQALALVRVHRAALEEVGQRDEGAALAARGEERRQRALGEALHLAQADAQRERLAGGLDREAARTAVHVRRQDRHAQAARLLDVDARVVVARLAGQEARQVLGREVRLSPPQPGGER